MARITTWLRSKDVLAERDESIPSNTGLESCLRKWLPSACWRASTNAASSGSSKIAIAGRASQGRASCDNGRVRRVRSEACMVTICSRATNDSFLGRWWEPLPRSSEPPRPGDVTTRCPAGPSMRRLALFSCCGGNFAKAVRTADRRIPVVIAPQGNAASTSPCTGGGRDLEFDGRGMRFFDDCRAEGDE